MIDLTRLINQTSSTLSMKKQTTQAIGPAKIYCLIWRYITKFNGFGIFLIDSKVLDPHFQRPLWTAPHIRLKIPLTRALLSE